MSGLRTRDLQVFTQPSEVLSALHQFFLLLFVSEFRRLLGVEVSPLSSLGVLVLSFFIIQLFEPADVEHSSRRIIFFLNLVRCRKKPPVQIFVFEMNSVFVIHCALHPQARVVGL